jgi:replicative DNA helicase
MDPDEQFTRPPSSNLDAERYVLAAMMSSAMAAEEVCEVISPGDFYRPGHAELFLAMVEMYSAQEPVTPVTLRAWMERDGVPRSLNMQWPGYLLDLFALPVIGQMGVAHARIVWECSVRRRIEETGTRLAQLATSYTDDPAELIARAQQDLDLLCAGAVPDDNRALTTDQFLDLDVVHTSPVFPGLLWHQERAVIVGIEGDGKTMLAHQAAYCLAAGVHPFTFAGIPAGRALIIDLENPMALLQPRLAGLQRIAARHAAYKRNNVMLWARPGGIDLTRPAVAFKLADLIRRERPDLVVAGPVYKMFEEGDRDNPKHAAICRFFDQMRERYGVSVWLETHVPIAQTNGKRLMRPLGSGIWSRWPEFGISLERTSRKDGALKLGRFRGDRAEGRTWPEFIHRNRMPGGGWPWQAVYAAGTLMDPLGDQGEDTA